MTKLLLVAFKRKLKIVMMILRTKKKKKRKLTLSGPKIGPQFGQKSW